MPARASSAIALASTLRALDDERLAEVLRSRRIRVNRIADFFDLAEALLDRTSIQDALAGLDRRTLATISAAGEIEARRMPSTLRAIAELLALDEAETAEALRRAGELALVSSDSGRFAVWDAVFDQLRSWPGFGLPDTEELIESARRQPLVPGLAGEAAPVTTVSETVFDTLGALDEVLRELERAPAKQLSSGRISLPETRRLAAAAHLETAAVPELLAIAAAASLTATLDGHRYAAEQSSGWRELGASERWAVLAEGWLRSLPEGSIRMLTADWGDGALELLRWWYPAAAPEQDDAMRGALAQAELLGLSSEGLASELGVAVTDDSLSQATRMLATTLPDPIGEVYFLDDLSIATTGPLDPHLEQRLRRVADLDRRGVASSFRLSASSVHRALTLGETSASLIEFAGNVSRTGLPQPVRYLIEDVAKRFGTIRVGRRDPARLEGPSGYPSYIWCANPSELDRIMVERELAVLALSRESPNRAWSRVAAGAVLWSLVDAKYPVVEDDAEGRIVDRRRLRPSAHGARAERERDESGELVRRLREGAVAVPESAGTEWLHRQLELAVRGRVAVRVRVRLPPDDREVEYLVEPSSVSGGRLRARDRAADTERTLPLSHVVAVSVVETSPGADDDALQLGEAGMP